MIVVTGKIPKEKEKTEEEEINPFFTIKRYFKERFVKKIEKPIHIKPKK